MPAVWKKPSDCHISAKVWPIVTKLGMVTHIGPQHGNDPKNFEFLKIQYGVGHHLENHKNGDISVTV